MNAKLNYQVNSRCLTAFNPIGKELELNPEKNYLFDLSYLSVLSVQGDKASEFLQGQLTADMSKVTDIQMAPTAQCNLKGRILAFMDVLLWNGIKLVLPQDILEPTRNSLVKTALLSKVTIEEQKNYSCWGFYLQNPADLIPASTFLPKAPYAKAEGINFCYYHLGEGFYIFIINKEAESSLIQNFIQTNQILGSLSWHTLRISQHQLSIYPETRGLFLPHRLDLHQTPYLSFDKGCYKGQEIIARTHYKATLKHELCFYKVRTAQALSSGQKIFKADQDIEVGELVDYSYLDNEYYIVALSVLKNPPLEVRIEKAQVVQLEPFEQ